MNPAYTVAATIKRGLLAFPSLYRTPGDVLHQVLAVNGNGYEWQAGQLVPWGIEREDADAWLAQQISEAGEKDRYGLRLHYEQMQHGYAFTKANIDRIVEHGEYRFKGQLYPLCQYAKIVCVPDDVQNDWLETCHRFATDYCVTLRGRGELSARDQEQLETLQALARKFDDMLIARGERSTREEREAVFRKILAEIRREEKKP